MTLTGQEKWEAFGITVLAGLAALIGAFSIFCIKKSQLKHIVPIALAFSTGIIIHITFLHLISHAVEDFQFVLGMDEEHHGHDHHRRLLHEDHHMDEHEIEEHEETTLTEPQIKSLSMTLSLLCNIGGILIMYIFQKLSHKLGDNHETLDGQYGSFKNNVKKAESGAPLDNDDVNENLKHNESKPTAFEISDRKEGEQREQEELRTISYGIAISTILHHFPEGLCLYHIYNCSFSMNIYVISDSVYCIFKTGVATYVALVYETELGILVALALSLHDIPVGMALSVTTFVATESYWKPFVLCGLAAIAYPIGAFVGWIIVEANSDSELLAAILFGIVSGILMYLILVQMYPTAIKALIKADNPQTTKWSYIALFIGFFLMEILEIVLTIADVHSH